MPLKGRGPFYLSGTMMLVRALAIVMLAMLAACGNANSEAGGVTPAEAEALNKAAEQLDRQAPPPRVGQPAAQPQK